MHLLARLYHTQYCADIVPVSFSVNVPISYLLSLVLHPCFIPCRPGIVSALHLVLCLLVLVVCCVLHSVLGANV